MAKKIYDYTGKGAFLPGIPARDLTDDDWDELDGDQRKLVRDNAKHGDKEATKHAAIFTAVEEPKKEPAPDKPATTKGG